MEEELGTGSNVTCWHAAVDGVQTTTACTRLSLLQLRLMHGAHLSKSRLSAIYPRVGDK